MHALRKDDCLVQLLHQLQALLWSAIQSADQAHPMLLAVDPLAANLQPRHPEECFKVEELPLLVTDPPVMAGHKVPQLLGLHRGLVEHPARDTEAMDPVHVVDGVEDHEVVDGERGAAEQAGPGSPIVAHGIGVEQGGVQRPDPDALEVAHDPLQALEALHLLRLGEARVHEALHRVEAARQRVGVAPEEPAFVREGQADGCRDLADDEVAARPGVHPVVAPALDQHLLVEGHEHHAQQLWEEDVGHHRALAPAVVGHQVACGRRGREGRHDVLDEHLEQVPPRPPVVQQRLVRRDLPPDLDERALSLELVAVHGPHLWEEENGQQ
mmetsp:Transcript_10360/g.32238  ORF Transcript_10360/g.32238 Transcript_10360/m.32238 type:complete len:326 (-) Transcript_10360:692-1669(-)